jgi:hypothetical protein
MTVLCAVWRNGFASQFTSFSHWYSLAFLRKNIDTTSTAENRGRNTFERKKSNLGQVFDSVYWMAKLAYLTDIFSMLNEFKLSMLGRWYNIFVMNDKSIWEQAINLVQNNRYMYLQCVSSVLPNRNWLKTLGKKFKNTSWHLKACVRKLMDSKSVWK